jgi:hypothetical protein
VEGVVEGVLTVESVERLAQAKRVDRRRMGLLRILFPMARAVVVGIILDLDQAERRVVLLN